MTECVWGVSWRGWRASLASQLPRATNNPWDPSEPSVERREVCAGRAAPSSGSAAPGAAAAAGAHLSANGTGVFSPGTFSGAWLQS